MKRDAWTVQEAKAHLSEVLRRARGGDPQRIGVADACVVVAEADWEARADRGLGAWLADSAPRGAPLPDAPRASRRGDPFDDDAP